MFSFLAFLRFYEKVSSAFPRLESLDPKPIQRARAGARFTSACLTVSYTPQHPILSYWFFWESLGELHTATSDLTIGAEVLEVLEVLDADEAEAELQRGVEVP